MEIISKSIKTIKKNAYLFWYLFCNTIGLAIFTNFLIFQYQPNYLPKESELHYSEGYLYFHEFKEARGKTIYRVAYLKNQGDFRCDYRAHYDFSSGSCGFKKELTKKISGKKAKIGWYRQPDFLWKSNPYPQLVTLEVEGNMISDYDEAVQRLAHYRNTYFTIGLAISLPVLIFLIFCFIMAIKRNYKSLKE